MSNESFIRWQERTISQMGYAINTILVLETATLGFISDKLVNNKFCSCSKNMVVSGATILVISISILLSTILVRLKDFRLTAHIARSREKGEKTNLGKYRAQSKMLGRRTWILFCLSTVLFIISELLIVLAITIEAVN